MNKEIIVYLMGGLGNQMFQYALGRSLCLRNSANLYLDQSSGFLRDFMYKRIYELGSLPIIAGNAGSLRQTPFWFEQLLVKVFSRRELTCIHRPWGMFLSEDLSLSSVTGIANYEMKCQRLWLRGYWQSETYFNDYKAQIAHELCPPRPSDSFFLQAADLIENCNSVAVGVRLFEEVPGESKTGVGGLTQKSFYRTAALQIAESYSNPVFFVFCTLNSPIIHTLDLPGQVFYITHENGFTGTLQRLWLISRCRHHILSNSSFYWWGAWLAEQNSPATQVYASDNFTNKNTIPARWTTIHHNA